MEYMLYRHLLMILMNTLGQNWLCLKYRVQEVVLNLLGKAKDDNGGGITADNDNDQK